jgi:hypothetical protein
MIGMTAIREKRKIKWNRSEIKVILRSEEYCSVMQCPYLSKVY